MVFKFAYFMELTKAIVCKVSVLYIVWVKFYRGITEGLHFIFLGFKISTFGKTDYKLSTFQVSNPSDFNTSSQKAQSL